MHKKLDTLPDLCVSSLRRGHANLLCIVPILSDVPRRESTQPPLQSAFCPTLPTPPMPGASKWGQILFSKALVLVLLQGICARRESNPGHKHGRLVCCRYTTGAMRQAKKQGSGCWRLSHCPFFPFLSQATQRCSQTSDSEGIRTPAGRAQWISGPSPWPLGHTVMLVPASHIQHKVYTSRPHSQHHVSKQTHMHDKVHLHQPESSPGHIDGNDAFCH